MERIINPENDLDHNVELDAVEYIIDCVCKGEVVLALSEIKKCVRCIYGVCLLLVVSRHPIDGSVISQTSK